VSRQADCGPSEARARAKIVRKYLEMAELAQTEDLAEAKNVAAGNAVLAGIAASDAICCTRLRRRHRGQDHAGAVTLLRTIHPDGRKLADALLAAQQRDVGQAVPTQPQGHGARSNSTLAGSWTANELHHGANASDRARSRPVARIVSVSSDPPAWETTPRPAPSTRTRG
jgi:hypothetical protein